MNITKHLRLGTDNRVPLLKNGRQTEPGGHDDLPTPKLIHSRLNTAGNDDTATVFFIGTATTIIDWQGFRILTDPNFLHAGDHVHLGPGVNATRQTNPALDLDSLPALDCILLSHYHEDHFDKVVEDSINRDFPIITTTHATRCLTDVKDEPFRNVTSLEPFESLKLDISSESQRGQRLLKITGMPGKHVPPGARDGHLTNGNRIDRFIRCQVLRISNRISWRSIRCRICHGPVRFEANRTRKISFDIRVHRTECGASHSTHESNCAHVIRRSNRTDPSVRSIFDRIDRMMCLRLLKSVGGSFNVTNMGRVNKPAAP